MGTDINQVFTAKTANTPGDLGVNGLAITLNKGAMNGYPLEHPGAGATSQTKNLYKVLNGTGYKPFEVTEAVGGTTYQSSPSAPTVAPATPPLACASASR